MRKLFPLLWPHPTPGDQGVTKLAFVLCQRAIMQISAVLAQWFLRRRIIRYFSYINTCKNSFPCTMSEGFHVNFSFFISVVLEKKIFK
jgi:hypothetical protein